jgi:hypothetical protein
LAIVLCERGLFSFMAAVASSLAAPAQVIAGMAGAGQMPGLLDARLARRHYTFSIMRV